MIGPPPRSTLFPYTTLFRSLQLFVSTHAPHVGRDDRGIRRLVVRVVSIHAAHRGGGPAAGRRAAGARAVQFPPRPARGGRPPPPPPPPPGGPAFHPPPPRGAATELLFAFVTVEIVSIHAPH